ncbi:NOP5/NOP56 family protein [Nanoarchaeota archaeon]
MAILYSNITGAYLFSDSFEIAEKIEFSKDKIISNNELLEQGEWLEEEKELIQKQKDKVLYIGFKKEPQNNTDIMWNQDAFSKISQKLKENKEESEKLRQNNIIIAKNKIKKSVKKDLLVMQTINHIEELNKISNMMAKRLREWYELYNPEFSKSLDSHEKFTELIIQKDKKELLAEIGADQATTMGADLEKEDVEAIIEFAKELQQVFELRQKQTDYLETIMKQVCPNVLEITGPTIGANLISLAGSLKKMSEFPASTIQMLGAEKALFRHLKTGARPPKYGVLINHPYIMKADRKNKGKVARLVADKISIASKVDYFKGEFVGDKLKADIEKRLK